MKIIKRLLLGAAALLVGLFIIIFILENRQPVALTLFGQSSAMLPLASFLVLAFLVGLFVGPLLGSAVYMRMHHRQQVLSRMLADSRQKNNSKLPGG